MARFFKKRRRKPGPSKNEKKVRRNSEKDGSDSSLRQLYPELQQLKVSLTYLGAQGQILGKDAKEIGSSDPVALKAECPGFCGGTPFDLEGRIDEMIEAGQAKHEYREKCVGQNLASPDPCGAEILCTIELSFTA